MDAMKEGTKPQKRVGWPSTTKRAWGRKGAKVIYHNAPGDSTRRTLSPVSSPRDSQGNEKYQSPAAPVQTANLGDGNSLTVQYPTVGIQPSNLSQASPSFTEITDNSFISSQSYTLAPHPPHSSNHTFNGNESQSAISGQQQILEDMHILDDIPGLSTLGTSQSSLSSEDYKFPIVDQTYGPMGTTDPTSSFALQYKWYTIEGGPGLDSSSPNYLPLDSDFFKVPEWTIEPGLDSSSPDNLPLDSGFFKLPEWTDELYTYESQWPSTHEGAAAANVEKTAASQSEKVSATCATSLVGGSRTLPSAIAGINDTMNLPTENSDSFSSRTNTLSSFTEDDTDCGEDEITGSLRDFHFPGFSEFSREGLSSQEQIKDALARRVFSPMQEQLIDRIMKEFWAIFDQERDAILNSSPATVLVEPGEDQKDNTDTTCEEAVDPSGNEASGSTSETGNRGQKSTRSSLGRHSREGEDDEFQNNGEERSPKRPRSFLSPSQTQDDNTKFACPYRKRDSRKYCVQHWRSCALTPLDTVARVKGHLYRYHRIFPCQRCQELFKDPDAVKLHLKNPEGCELRDIEHTDGVTPEIVEKLRSKKKAQRDQTEAERWRDIYKLLFPNEMTPSPYFETVQEDTALSPDSRELADYEEYCRRELPKDFRAALGEIVHNESQPMEESIRNRLLDIVRDCQDRVFSRYRSSAGRATATPSINPTSPDSQMISMRETRNDMSLTANGTSELSFGRCPPPFFRPPSPQSHLRSRLEVSDLQNNPPKAPDGKDPSDSGYSSNTSGLQSQHPSSFHSTIDSASLSTSQSHVASSESFSANAEATWNLDDGLFGMNPRNDVMNGDDTSTFNQSWAGFNAQSAEGNAWNPYMSNSEVEDPFSSDQPL